MNKSTFEIGQNDCVKVLKSGETCELALSYTPDFNSNDAQGDLIIDIEGGTNITVALLGSNLDTVDDDGNDYEYNDDYDNEDIDWYSDSDVWFEEDDGFNLDASILDLDGFATLSAEVDGEGGAFEFDFDFENDFDENYCSYYVDGKLIRTIRGANKSTSHHITQLSKGKHKLVWVYKKKSENSGSLKIKNIKLLKSDSSTATPTPTNTTTPVGGNSLVSTPTQESSPGTTNRSGGGSTDILFISSLLLLLGRSRKLFVRR